MLLATLSPHAFYSVSKFRRSVPFCCISVDGDGFSCANLCGQQAGNTHQEYGKCLAQIKAPADGGVCTLRFTDGTSCRAKNVRRPLRSFWFLFVCLTAFGYYIQTTSPVLWDLFSSCIQTLTKCSYDICICIYVYIYKLYHEIQVFVTCQLPKLGSIAGIPKVRRCCHTPEQLYSFFYLLILGFG